MLVVGFGLGLALGDRWWALIGGVTTMALGFGVAIGGADPGLVLLAALLWAVNGVIGAGLGSGLRLAVHPRR
jgi:hypothetical protein